MSTFKKAKVVMLPTNKKAGPISVGNKSGIAEYHFFQDIEKRGIYLNHTFQHLYFLSDDPIEIGDYVYYGREGSASIARQGVNPSGANSDPMMKKVIGTTDKSLDFNDYLGSGQNRTWKILPQPSQSFIEKFVEEYNKGNAIEEVMVGYYHSTLGSNKEELTNNEKLVLKINPKDHTITIKKAKESWTREEIIDDIEKAIIQGLNIGQYRDLLIREGL